MSTNTQNPNPGYEHVRYDRDNPDSYSHKPEIIAFFNSRMGVKAGKVVQYLDAVGIPDTPYPFIAIALDAQQVPIDEYGVNSRETENQEPQPFTSIDEAIAGLLALLNQPPEVGLSFSSLTTTDLEQLHVLPTFIPLRVSRVSLMLSHVQKQKVLNKRGLVG